MSKNINQIFGTNPATSMQDTDLFYLGRAPYGLTNDMAILWSDVVLSIGGEFLKKVNNFTDVADPAVAFKNLGTGNGESITITDSDFTAGVYQIPVPFPAQIVCNNLAVPGQEIRLPVANTPFDSPALGQGVTLKMIDCDATNIALSNGTIIDNLEGFEQSRYICSDKSTAAGSYTILPEVYLVNSKSGRIFLSSDNLQANDEFTPSNYTVLNTGPWDNNSITANLAGIDQALASFPSMAASYAEMYFQANATVTPFGGANTPTKVLATAYNTGEIQDFTQVGGTLTYTGTETRIVHVAAMLTATYSGTAQNTSFYIALNGSVVAKSKQSSLIGVVTPSPLPLPVQATLSISTNDTIELWVENNDNTNSITVYDLNFSVSPLNASAPSTILPSYAEMYFQDNATVTTITAANTPVKISATYNSDELKDFTHFNGTLTYQSPTSKKFSVTVDLTANYSGTAQNTSFYIALNGSVVAKSKQKTYIGPVSPGDEPNPVQALLTLVTGDTIEVWVENNDNGNDIIVTDFNLMIESIDAIGTSPNFASLSSVIYVDGIAGNDSNTGEITSPLKTYEAARALADSRNPQYGSGQCIVITTTISIVGDFIISPFVNVIGYGKLDTIIGFSGNLVLDAKWGTTAFPETQIMNLAIIGQSINCVYPAFQSYSYLRFENCSMQLLNAGPTATFTGSDGSGNYDAEFVVFDNCSLDLQDGIPEPQFIANNVNLFLFNSRSSNAMDVSVTSSTVQAKLLIQNCIGNLANVTLNAASTGTLNTQITACNPVNAALTINGSSNSVLIDPSSNNFSSYIFGSGASWANINGGSPLVLYIDQLNGNDNNSGSINYPMQNYEAARLRAIANLGSNLQLIGCLIVVLGNQNITGDMTLTPGISINSQASPYSAGFVVNGNVVLDPTWGTNFSYVMVKNVYIFLSGGDYNFIFPAIDPTGSSFLKFVNCQFNTGGFITITGFGSDGQTENVTFENCTVDFFNYTPGFIAENVNLYLINTDLTVSAITATASSANGNDYKLVVNNARFYTNDITVITNNTSTLTSYIESSMTKGRTLTVNGANNTVNIDSTSYQFGSVVLTGGATISNIFLPSLADGVNANANFLPNNYTPTAPSATIDVKSVTSNLNGIDLALPQTTLNGITFGASVGMSSPSIIRSHEIKLGNMVVGSVVFSFTATAALCTINVNKTYGSSFSTSANQAIGTGICAKTPTTAIGDASVQIVQANFLSSQMQFVMNTNGNVDYIAEINFTYEVT